MTWAEYTWRSK